MTKTFRPNVPSQLAVELNEALASGEPHTICGASGRHSDISTFQNSQKNWTAAYKHLSRVRRPTASEFFNNSQCAHRHGLADQTSSTHWRQESVEDMIRALQNKFNLDCASPFRDSKSPAGSR